MATDEEILKSWSLMSCYRRHRTELIQLAIGARSNVCKLYGVQPTLAQSQYAFWLALHTNDLFLKTILVKEKPHIKSDMHLTLGQCLARYVVRENWTYITSFRCP